MKTAPAALCLLLSFALSTQAFDNRGVWFWGDDGSPYGSIAIVGNSAAEDQTIAFLTGHGVKRVYGSYQNRPVSQPGTIAAWNAKLDAAGLESQCLFSDNDLIFSSVRPDLLAKIENRVIQFNVNPSRTVPQRFDAIHLDLEPQGLPGWGLQTAATKRDWLLELRDTYAEIRALLDFHGLAGFPVFADLPVWFDKLPADGGQIGWLDTADRDQWFADIMASLTGVTFMAFQQTSNSAVLNSMSLEHDSLIDPAKIRVGHMCDIGATWINYAQFKNMMYWMEWYYGSRAVDIQSYRRWREGLSGAALVAVPITFEPAVAGRGGEIVLDPAMAGSFVLLESTDLDHWVEATRFDLPQPRQVRVPFEVTGPRKFWQVLEIGTPDLR